MMKIISKKEKKRKFVQFTKLFDRSFDKYLLIYFITSITIYHILIYDHDINL